jgi:hypothetical protein
MKYLFIAVAALALIGTASATSSSADCCGHRRRLLPD